MKVFRLVMQRAIYIGRFLYWSARHRSISRARWVLDYEGITWN